MVIPAAWPSVCKQHFLPTKRHDEHWAQQDANSRAKEWPIACWCCHWGFVWTWEMHYRCFQNAEHRRKIGEPKSLGRLPSSQQVAFAVCTLGIHPQRSQGRGVRWVGISGVDNVVDLPRITWKMVELWGFSWDIHGITIGYNRDMMWVYNQQYVM